MAGSARILDVYLESGQKLTFAGAVDWPGWSRSGRDEASALQALVDYGSRYARVVEAAGLSFRLPAGLPELAVIERVPGDSSTDFGAPGKVPASDARPVDDAGLGRLRAILRACWGAFGEAERSARGKELRKGPRGGGRELDAIVEHVLGAERGYLARSGWKLKLEEELPVDEASRRVRAAILEALGAGARGELPERGPRGGAYWPPRYVARRVAWHVLDHAWEIEDRII